MRSLEAFVGRLDLHALDFAKAQRTATRSSAYHGIYPGLAPSIQLPRFTSTGSKWLRLAVAAIKREKLLAALSNKLYET